MDGPVITTSGSVCIKLIAPASPTHVLACPAHDVRYGPRPGTRAVVAAKLLAIGVVRGTAGLFPGYLGGASLAQQLA